MSLASIRAVGDAAVGLIGSSRYSFTYDGPIDDEFVAAWKKEYGNVPDTFEGEQWQCMKVFDAGITKSRAHRGSKLRPALEKPGGQASAKAKCSSRKMQSPACSRASWSRCQKPGFDTRCPR